MKTKNICNRCGRALTTDQLRRIPPWLSIPAVFAMAFFHGGLWLQTEFARPYCARCRAQLVFIVALLAAAVFAAVLWGAKVWLRVFRR